MTPPNSELAWKLADYHTAGTEPPAHIISNPNLTEGEMMTDDEIEDFIKDSIATLRILSDKRSPRYAELYEVFRADLAHLTELGRMTEDDYNDLTSPDNVRF